MTRGSILILAVLALTGSVLVSGGASASEPAENTLTVPSSAGSSTVSWTGTLQSGATGGANECPSVDDPTADTHQLTLEVPDMGPELTYEVTIATSGDEEGGVRPDIVLTVFDSEGTVVGNSDSNGTLEEQVVLQEMPAGVYTVVVCPFTNGLPHPYEGTATAVTEVVGALPPAADPQGLRFSAAVPADIQRDEGEPLIEISPDGRMYTCGPTGFSQAEDYWQVSEDGGDQFHLLGEPPRGQQSLGGGGDCALAISPTKNDTGFHQVSYVGLSGLLEFATARSADGGHTIEANAFSLVGAGVDRQWIVASSDERVFLNFNRIVPNRVTEVCTSTDGGFTYPSCQEVAPDPLFPGPMKSIPADQNPFGDEPIIYFPWTQGTTVKLAVSLDDGVTWNNCQIATTAGQPGLSFPVADHDGEGEYLYFVYGDKADFNTYFNAVPVANLDRCDGGTEEPKEFTQLPGVSSKTVVNRSGIPTSVFPWIAAGGQPGRVAVSFYGTPTAVAADAPQDAESSADDRTWHVYVNQSVNALAAAPAFSQVQATTHPNHYGQICLLGLGCTTGGDRSLVDFFAIDYNPKNGEVAVVFNRAHKQPSDFAGTVSTPLVTRQISGPSNGGGTVSLADHEPLRSSSDDPTGDALADYSSLFAPPATTNAPGADLTGVEIVDPIDPATGEPSPDGGFTVQIHVDDLSNAAMQEALQATRAQSLLFVFRMVDGFRYSAAVASWNPASGFRYGYNEYVGNSGECALTGTDNPVAGSGDQCLLYPGSTSIAGAADQESGIITMTVPLALLSALDGLPAGPEEHPTEVEAKPGDRIYTSAAFSLSNSASPDAQVQSFLYPLDNTAAMDFLIPGGPGSGDGGGTTGGGAPGDGSDSGGSGVTPVTGGGTAAVALALAGLGAVALRRRDG